MLLFAQDALVKACSIAKDGVSSARIRKNDTVTKVLTRKNGRLAAAGLPRLFYVPTYRFSSTVDEV